jgi:hypothetical protein
MTDVHVLHWLLRKVLTINDQTLSRNLLLLEPRSFSTLYDVDYTFFSEAKLHYVTWKIYIAERRFKGFSISNT